MLDGELIDRAVRDRAGARSGRGGCGATTIVSVAVAFAARLPSGSVSTPSEGVAPPVADTNVTSAGSVSVTTAAVSVEGPLLVALIV